MEPVALGVTGMEPHQTDMPRGSADESSERKGDPVKEPPRPDPPQKDPPTDEPPRQEPPEGPGPKRV
jgi:hypothetical protein